MGNYAFENLASYKIIDHLYDERKDFIILGLCGRVGSGVSTVSGILQKRFEELQLPVPGFDNPDLNAAHEYRILYTYANENWKPFFKIRTSALITRHILSDKEVSIDQAINNFIEFLLKLCKEKQEKESELRTKFQKITEEFFEKEMRYSEETFKKFGWITGDCNPETLFKEFKKVERNEEKSSSGKTVYSVTIGSSKVAFEFSYYEREKDYAFKNVELSKLVDIYAELRNEKSGFKDAIWYFLLKQYLYAFLPDAANQLWNEIRKHKKSLSTQALQCMGNNLRLNKRPFFENGFEEDAYVSLAEDVNLAIKVLRAYQLKMEKPKTDDEERTVIVIDSIKNPYESLYLKARYNNYYLIGVYTEDSERRKRLRECEHFTDEDIKALDIIEQNSEFKKKIKEHGDCLDKKAKSPKNKEENIDKEDVPDIIVTMYDAYKDRGLLDNLEYISPFVLQNVSSCLESADILINNRSDNKSYGYLKNTLLRYVSLILNPGIVLPTAVERCMQIANTAKLNSGCISRQVGAVLTDKDYHLLSIGWNQQPEGQVPCAYRDLCELYHHWNSDAYSDYENDDYDEYQEAIKEQVETLFDSKDSPLTPKGKLPRYCFKDYYNGIKNDRNQVHTRALHAEETAFLNLGANKEYITEGILFTTSSPCELCSKKAMYLGVSKIYYVEPYPGVSQKHVLSMGERRKRPSLILFTGAIGIAYTKLFSPLLAHKDENEMWLGEKMNTGLLKKLEKRKEKTKEVSL